jgi:hypothetical protein
MLRPVPYIDLRHANHREMAELVSNLLAVKTILRLEGLLMDIQDKKIRTNSKGIFPYSKTLI